MIGCLLLQPPIPDMKLYTFLLALLIFDIKVAMRALSASTGKFRQVQDPSGTSVMGVSPSAEANLVSVHSALVGVIG